MGARNPSKKTLTDSSAERIGYYATMRAYSPLLLFFALLLFLSFDHFYPQAAYPLRALFLVTGLGIVLVTLLMIGFQGARIPREGRIGIYLYGLFFLWCWIRNLASPVPAMGRPFLGMILEGLWILGGVQIVLALEKSPGSSVERPLGMSAPPLSLFEAISLRSLAMIYFVILLFLFSLHGIYQYFIGFEKQLEMVKDAGLYQGEDPVSEGILYALRERRASSRFGNPNLLAAFLSLSLPFLLQMLFKSPSPDRKKVWIFRAVVFLGIILAFFTAILTRSRGGILSLLFGGTLFLVCYFLLCLKKEATDTKTVPLVLKRVFLLLVLLILFLVIVGIIQNATKSTDIRGASFWERLFLTATIKERMYYLLTGWRIIKQNPLFGSGPAGYSLLYPRFRCFGAHEAQYAHNFIVQLWAELGMLGALLFMIFAVYVVRSALGDSGKKPYILPALIGFLTFLFNSLLEYSFYHSSLFLDFCLCAGLILGASPNEIPRTKGRKPIMPGLTRSYFQFAWPILLSLAFFPSLIFRPFLGAVEKQFGDDATEGNEYERALKFYQKAARYQPDNPWYEARIGQSLLKLGDPVKAEEHLRKALDLNPLSASLRDDLSQLYEATFRLEDAARMARSAAEAYPTKALYRFHLAQLLLKQGNLAEAKKAALEAIRLELDKDTRNHYETWLKELNR